MLKHWREVKARHPGTILFYRVGDFYEMFHEDAELAARVLAITLTSRGDGVPLAGVPVKAAADYLRQLIGAGHRVAICEQVEDPKLARGLVRREVVETVTPGALLQEGWLAGGKNNFLVALAAGSERVGLAAIDLSTGEFLLETIDPAGTAEALGRLGPAEVVVPEELEAAVAPGVLRTVREGWEFDPELAREELARRFALASLDGLGVGPDDAPALGAAGALLRYLTELQPSGLPHLARPAVRRSDALLWLDEMTRRNLELVEPLRADARGCTLLETIDATVTPMGGRLLRQWLLSPLRDPAAIAYRLDAVETLVRDGILTSAAGKVTLLSPAKMPQDYDVLADDRVGAWEVLHHLVAFLERDGLPAAGALLASAQARPDGAIDTELVKELAFLLFAIAEKNGWTQDALAFNTVATAWPDVVSASRSVQPGTGEQAAFDFTQED
jgi:DNA mismatch repair protein MutS